MNRNVIVTRGDSCRRRKSVLLMQTFGQGMVYVFQKSRQIVQGLGLQEF